MKQFHSNVKREYHKIKWPTKKETGKSLALCVIGIAAICILAVAADSVGLALVSLFA